MVFDSRPVLSYYLMVLVCGSSFVAAGVFFSSFTRNQIVAAVLTFAWLLFLFLAGYIPDLPIDQFGKGFKQVLSKLGYFSQWQASLSGQLALPDLILHASLAVFWLFLTAKVLEARKWL
jgi:ABC-2 type transport system permease protein